MGLPPQMHRMNSKEVKQLQQLLVNHYGAGLDADGYLYVATNKDDVFLLNRDIDNVDVSRLRVINMGLYVGQYSANRTQFRFSIEGAALVPAVRQLVELTPEQVRPFLYGEDLEGFTGAGWVIVCCGQDVLGCALVRNGVLVNHTPKGRRIGSVS